MSFLIRGLDAEPFAPLFELNDADLRAIGAQRVHADEADAYPCRVSLTRVAVGEELLLLNHAHQTTGTSPYRAAGPIFVSRSGKAGTYRGELPPMMRDRLLSLRAYDAAAFIVDAEVAEGEDVLEVIGRFFANTHVAHIDAHFARRGCFAARIERA
ncbi:DUF1203 domain-containing protein [Microvirga lotononidis]|uniref:DUF1203 domain-containing protein n=1 Tax=Microvirga lotononidis TaxID=864069 RepID=I4YNW9_9HYPH|nr:DUF1203 domain-containing protein [Microvirga lotononidis]EIM25661.1 Protein of unknown function (DUF1203) [Microvirga lotononidis]WQO26455.1 DUF1203 domain-containing protein [Microvirga lotononidis]